MWRDDWYDTKTSGGRFERPPTKFHDRIDADGRFPPEDGRYRLYSRKKNPKTGKRRNLGTFGSRAAALKHERAIQYFKRA